MNRDTNIDILYHIQHDNSKNAKKIEKRNDLILRWLCCIFLGFFLCGLAIGAGVSVGPEPCIYTLSNKKLASTSQNVTSYYYSVEYNLQKYIFKNYFRLNNHIYKNTTCSMIVYNGTDYDDGMKSIYQINQTVILNYYSHTKKCYKEPLFVSCSSAVVSAIVGMVLLGISILFFFIIIVFIYVYTCSNKN